MTSLATNRRTVSMISRRTSGSVGGRRRGAVGSGGHGENTTSLVDVDVDLRERRMFPMAAALMHHALRTGRGALRGPRRGPGRRRRWTFRDLDELSTAFGRHLAARGVGPGDRVAVMTSNRPEFVVAVHAISKIGAAAVLLSPAWKAVEVGHALELTAPVHAVADGPAVDLLGELLGERPGHRSRPSPTAGRRCLRRRRIAGA